MHLSGSCFVVHQSQADRKELLETLARLQTEHDQLAKELEVYAACDPEVLDAKRKQSVVCRDAANRWTGAVSWGTGLCRAIEVFIGSLSLHFKPFKECIVARHAGSCTRDCSIAISQVKTSTSSVVTHSPPIASVLLVFFCRQHRSRQELVSTQVQHGSCQP